MKLRVEIAQRILHSIDQGSRGLVGLVGLVDISGSGRRAGHLADAARPETEKGASASGRQARVLPHAFRN